MVLNNHMTMVVNVSKYKNSFGFEKQRKADKNHILNIVQNVAG